MDYATLKTTSIADLVGLYDNPDTNERERAKISEALVSREEEFALDWSRLSDRARALYKKLLIDAVTSGFYTNVQQREIINRYPAEVTI